MKKILFLLSLVLLFAPPPVFAGDAPTMSKDELKAQLASKDLVILDVRSGRDWSSSEFKIKGAVRAAGSDLAKWSANYKKDQKLVLYCA